MGAQPASGEFSSVCSYLGLADDADSHATYATEAHRCYRLPNPTRIAANHQETYCLGAEHQTCPVYQGEGVPRPAAAASAASAAPAASGAEPRAAVPPAAAPGELRPKGGPSPFGGNRPAGAARPGAPRTPAARRPGLNNPRPRAGGITMPTLTIAIFALAIVIFGIAVAIQFLANGDDGGDTPASIVGVNQTNTALAKTPATTASSATPRPGTTTPGQTPGTTTTPGAGQTPGTGAGTYTVESGDFCGTIATDNNLTLDAFLALNPGIDCNNLQIGQQVKLR